MENQLSVMKYCGAFAFHRGSCSVSPFGRIRPISIESASLIFLIFCRRCFNPFDSLREEMCGIFAYLNHGVSRKRKDVTRMLIGGLKRLEYRGYDSAGIAIDGDAITSCQACRYALLFSLAG